MKINIGISFTSHLRELLSDQTEEKDLRSNYLNAIEDFLTFVKGNKLNTIELGSFPPYDGVLLNEIASEIANITEGMSISFHLPAWEVNIAALNEGIRNAALSETISQIELCNRMGISRVCIHPGSYGSMTSFYKGFPSLIKEHCETSVKELLKVAENNKMELLVENIPFGSPYYRDPIDFEPLVAEGAGFLLDTAHAITSGNDPLEFVNKFGDKIKEVHLVDGFTHKPDTHLPLGDGEVNFKSLFVELEKINFTGPYMIELVSTDDVLQSLKYIKDLGIEYY